MQQNIFLDKMQQPDGWEGAQFCLHQSLFGRYTYLGFESLFNLDAFYHSSFSIQMTHLG